jgi:hypothetical protein
MTELPRELAQLAQLPRRRRVPTVIWSIGICAAIIAGLLYAFWPRPAYRLFVSQPLGKKGVRAEFMVPTSWVQDGSSAAGIEDVSYVSFHPPDRPEWWPAFVRRWFPSEDQNLNCIVLVSFVDNPFAYGGRTQPGGQVAINGRTVFMATETRKAGDQEAYLVYGRDSRPTMDLSKKTIFNSFRLLAGKGAGN